MRMTYEKFTAPLIVSLAFVLRWWGVADISTPIGDEQVFIPAVKNFFSTGHAAPDGWWHPPFHYFLLHANMWLLGDTPYGWRLAGVLLGSLSVLLVIALGRELLEDKRMAYLAGLLLAVEPFHVVLSRSSFREVPATLFFLAAVYCIVMYCRRSRAALLPAGIFLGLSIAMKWYYVPALAVLVLYAMFEGPREERSRALRIWHLISLLVVVPLGIYLLTYYPWFQRGYGLGDFFTMQIDTYRENQNIVVQPWMRSFLSSTAPAEWFIKPLISARKVAGTGGWGQFFVFMNNPPVWLLTIPAATYTIRRVWKERSWPLGLIAALFLSLYLPFALIARDIFLYSALVVLPFAFLMIAGLLVNVMDRMGRKNITYGVVMLMILLWGLYLYPFVTSRSVPLLLYGPFLSSTGTI